MTLNAKERRKLARQQQQHQQAESDASVSVNVAPVKLEAVEEVTKTEPTEEETTTPAEPKMNAKERRKLLRQQRGQAEIAESSAEAIKIEAAEVVPKAETAPAAVAASAPPSAGERVNAKERRLLKRKAERGDQEPTTVKSEHATQASKKRKRKTNSDGDEEQDAKKKRIHLTLFVGQLPFKVTQDQIRKHFSEAGEIQLRMLTDKKTGKFKGTAFIEVKDSKALGAALSRHHTLLNGRRINVELTASGGGNNSEQRRGKIDGLRKKQSEKQIEKTRALVQKHIDSKDSKLSEDDVDDRVIDFLSWFDYTTAKKALDEYTKSVSNRVLNKKAFFMGILKRFRQTDGVE